MRPLASYLMVLLWAAHYTTADSPRPLMPWYKVHVANARLEGNTIRTQKIRSRMQCAAVASLDPQAHLFCTLTPDTCTTHDVVVGSGYNDPTPGSVTDCWTRHLSDCDVEDERHLGDNCSDISVCQQGLLQPYQGPWNTAQSFYYPLTNNCVYWNTTEMTWDAARATCVDLGGDLFVAVTTHGLEQYVTDMPYNSWSSFTWLGIRNRIWLDGRPVAAEDWHSGRPDGNPLECCVIRPFLSVDVQQPRVGMRVDDGSCSKSYRSLCEIAVSPPQ